MSYCASRFQTLRRHTVEVKVGSVAMGGQNPVRIQSMTTSDTQDVAGTVRQSIALAEVGCEIIRITAPNVQAAQCLKAIRREFSAAGFANIPLVADIHFLPNAAMEAVEHVEKVRVNPGNYADKKKFAVREYSDNDYEAELERLYESFSPLVKRARELGRALRIGTNHGSLSDRIMNRYGDTPLGMVESALEFLRIAESHRFHDLVLSMKASNPKVMIEAYRLLVSRMNEENMHYPLHLGVTEAGDGEDGRIKSAIGIGSLLFDGLGDTIRVSLTEDSVYEIPVARALANKAMSLWTSPPAPPPRSENSVGLRPTDPQNSEGPTNLSHTSAGLQSTKPQNSEGPTPRPHTSVGLQPTKPQSSEGPTARPYTSVGLRPTNPPRVIVRPSPDLPLATVQAALASPRLADTPAEILLLSPAEAAKAAAGTTIFLELPDSATAADAAKLPAATAWLVALDGDTARAAAWAAAARDRDVSLAVSVDPIHVPALASALSALPPEKLLFTTPAAVSGSEHATGAYRRLASALDGAGLPSCIWIRNTGLTAVKGDPSFLSRLLDASILTGSLLCDGIGNLVSIETENDAERATRLTFNVLQGAGARISKTEFVACPSCGRTLFDLQTTTQRIRAQTGHLKGVKLAIMGCIVNGPGEMADADFGYVGGAPGKINLYVGKTCVQYNLPQSEADARLIALIKEHGKWIEPPDHLAAVTQS